MMNPNQCILSGPNFSFLVSREKLATASTYFADAINLADYNIHIFHGKKEAWYKVVAYLDYEMHPPITSTRDFMDLLFVILAYEMMDLYVRCLQSIIGEFINPDTVMDLVCLGMRFPLQQYIDDLFDALIRPKAGRDILSHLLWMSHRLVAERPPNEFCFYVKNLKLSAPNLSLFLISKWIKRFEPGHLPFAPELVNSICLSRIDYGRYIFWDKRLPRYRHLQTVLVERIMIDQSCLFVSGEGTIAIYALSDFDKRISYQTHWQLPFVGRVMQLVVISQVTYMMVMKMPSTLSIVSCFKANCTEFEMLYFERNHVFNIVTVGTSAFVVIANPVCRRKGYETKIIRMSITALTMDEHTVFLPFMTNQICCSRRWLYLLHYDAHTECYKGILQYNHGLDSSCYLSLKKVRERGKKWERATCFDERLVIFGFDRPSKDPIESGIEAPAIRMTMYAELDGTWRGGEFHVPWRKLERILYFYDEVKENEHPRLPYRFINFLDEEGNIHQFNPERGVFRVYPTNLTSDLFDDRFLFTLIQRFTPPNRIRDYEFTEERPK